VAREGRPRTHSPSVEYVPSHSPSVTSSFRRTCSLSTPVCPSRVSLLSPPPLPCLPFTVPCLPPCSGQRSLVARRKSAPRTKFRQRRRRWWWWWWWCQRHRPGARAVCERRRMREAFYTHTHTQTHTHTCVCLCVCVCMYICEAQGRRHMVQTRNLVLTKCSPINTNLPLGMLSLAHVVAPTTHASLAPSTPCHPCIYI
jgi:hypothetical protein